MISYRSAGATWSAELGLPRQYPQLCRSEGPWGAAMSGMVKKRRSGATLLGPGEFSMSELHEGYCVVSASSLYMFRCAFYQLLCS